MVEIFILKMREKMCRAVPGERPHERCTELPYYFEPEIEPVSFDVVLKQHQWSPNAGFLHA